VSKSSVSLWVRDIPCPERFAYVHSERRQEGLRKFNEARTARHTAETEAAAAEIGELTDREVLIAGAIAYWCEGGKSKSYRRSSDRVIFMNSDPGLVRFFLRFMDVISVQRSDLIFKVHIHESADVEAAHRFWEDVTAAPSDLFGKPTLKRHNPKTTRGNVGETYHGCLRIEVRRSGELYRKIEGWASGAMVG
jgi:hypothetical protein